MSPGCTHDVVEQGDEADEAGASDGASQLIPVVRRTSGGCDGGGMTEAKGRRRGMLAIVAFAAAASGCVANDPEAPSKATLDDLVRVRATRAEAAATLGSGYTWYAPGTAEWRGLEQFLAREDSRVYAPVAKAVGDKRPVMYYTTIWQQTWLFLDESERVQSYWTNTQ